MRSGDLCKASRKHRMPRCFMPYLRYLEEISSEIEEIKRVNQGDFWSKAKRPCEIKLVGYDSQKNTYLMRLSKYNFTEKFYIQVKKKSKFIEEILINFRL